MEYFRISGQTRAQDFLYPLTGPSRDFNKCPKGFSTQNRSTQNLNTQFEHTRIEQKTSVYKMNSFFLTVRFQVSFTGTEIQGELKWYLPEMDPCNSLTVTY